MTKLWRAATLIVLATVLVVGPASAVFATTGDDGGRDARPASSVDTARDAASDTVTDRVPERD